MQQNKYQELKDMHEALVKRHETVADRTNTQHKLLQSILVLMKNYDARLLTLQRAAFASNLITEDAFSEEVDNHLGLRRRADDESIEVGDVVWVRYTASHNGKAESEENLPLRIGSGSVVFEQALIGLPASAKNVEFTATMKEDKGEVKFTIDVLKVKVKMAEATEGAQDGTGTGTDSDEGRDETVHTGSAGDGADVNESAAQPSP
jgi:hypothetical protein